MPKAAFGCGLCFGVEVESCTVGNTVILILCNAIPIRFGAVIVDFLKACAVSESGVANGFYVFTDNDTTKACAIPECGAAYGGNAIRDSYKFKLFASIKCRFADSYNAIANRYGGKRGAIPECAIADRRYAIRDSHGIKLTAVFECAVRDSCNAIGNDYFISPLKDKLKKDMTEELKGLESLKPGDWLNLTYTEKELRNVIKRAIDAYDYERGNKEDLQLAIRKALKNYFYKTTKQAPLIVVSVVEV